MLGRSNDTVTSLKAAIETLLPLADAAPAFADSRTLVAAAYDGLAVAHGKLERPADAAKARAAAVTYAAATR